MTDCNEAIRPIRARMPVLLMPDRYDAWLNGDFEAAVAFQGRCFPDGLIEMTGTDELWVSAADNKSTSSKRDIVTRFAKRENGQSITIDRPNSNADGL